MMATTPINEHVFYVANMQQLQTLLTRIGESACKSKLALQSLCLSSISVKVNKGKLTVIANLER